MPTITADIKKLAESGVATHVGANHPEHGPVLAAGSGFRVYPEDAHADVFVDLRSSEHLLKALRADGRVAVVVSDPITYRSLQFKGRCREIREPSPLDLAWVSRSRELFTAAAALVGEPPSVTRNYWSGDVVCVTLSVEALYDQTPGPDAGRRLP